ncbi:hypothetical protein TNCV_331031 [Trichonephila clavipes]|nr:hypothetical protein TNCV_331031 [Trichonephila clavipes]
MQGPYIAGCHRQRSDMVVARCWQQWITEGRVYRRGGSGRPRNTNDRRMQSEEWLLTTSLASIQRHLPPSRHPVPSRETIRRRLTEVVWGAIRAIIFSGPSRRRGRYFNADWCYQVGAIYQRIMLVHILRDSPNNVFKDMTSYHGLPGHQIFRRACLGRQLQPSRDTGELTAQMQRLWQDLPQG